MLRIHIHFNINLCALPIWNLYFSNVFLFSILFLVFPTHTFLQYMSIGQISYPLFRSSLFYLFFQILFLVRVLLWSLHIHHLPAMSYISCLDGEEKSENTSISFPSLSAPLLAESALSLL